MPQSVGIASEASESAGYDPLSMDGLFVPPPLVLAFHRGQTWTTIGVGTEPGSYQFNALEYSGSRYAGGSFWINEQGRQSAVKGFASPVAAVHFAATEFDALAAYVRWIDASGFGTEHRFPNAPWHRLPIFCGWAEQTVESMPEGVTGIEAHDFATQKNYEDWIAILEKRGLPVGTIVIDDKWQKHYGTFDVNETKWPDLQGFIARQHAKNRHVLLWVPAAHSEGLAPRLCVLRNGHSIAADASNPSYEALLRQQIKHLVSDLGVNGLKKIGSAARETSSTLNCTRRCSELNSFADFSSSSTTNRTAGNRTRWSKPKRQTLYSVSLRTFSVSTTSGTERGMFPP